MRCKDGKLLQLLNLCFALWNEDAYTKNDAALQIEFARLRFCTPDMGNNLAVKVRYTLGSRKC